MELEAVEVAAVLGGEARDHFMAFVAVFMGYMVAAHFIGSQIPSRFAWAVSVVYTMFCYLPALGTIRVTQHLTWLGANHLATGAPPVSIYMPAFMIFFGWAVSIWYMIHVRRTAVS